MEALSLTNSDIKFSFDGKEYSVKKANLQQVIEFQRKAREITDEKDAGADMRIAAYAIYLILNSTDKNITETQILEKCPGDIDIMQVFTQLGFMNQQKAKMAREIGDALVVKP